MCRSENRGAAWAVVLSAIALMAGVSACNAKPATAEQNEPSSVMANQNIRLTVVVVAFEPQAIHDDFNDGTSRSYDLTTLAIESPAAYKGQRISVVHGVAPPSSSPLVEVGQALVVDVGEWLLKDSANLVPAEEVRIVSAH